MSVRSRNLKGKFYKSLSYISAGIVILFLIYILGTITIRGMPNINPEFIFTSEVEKKGFGGAVGNAVVGTILLSILSPMLATPFAIGTAIYLKRYAKDGPFVKGFSFLLEVLSGTPSIVLGIFGLLFLAFYMRHFTGGFSLMSGTIALALLILPVIEKATENALDGVPPELEEASYALSANKWETISRISLPYALNGIMTGILLGMGRAAEESAVVILTAGYSQFYPEWKIVPNDNFIFGVKIYPFQDLIGSLPIAVYHGYEFSNVIDISESFAAAFVLIVIVILINIGTRLILKRRQFGESE